MIVKVLVLFVVVLLSACGGGGWDRDDTSQTIETLSAPTALTATVQSASQINLAWPAVSGASYYRLYNNSNEIYGDSNLTYNNTGLSANTSYSYTLSACVSNDINSCSAVSLAVNATTQFNIPPVPSAPTATVQSASQINLAWPAVSGASYYRLYNNSSEIYGDSNLTYNNTGLSANTSYSYTLRACVSNDINSCSAVLQAVSAITLLNAPSAPTATVQSTSQINLAWPAVSGASYYRLYNNSNEIYGDSNLTYNNTGLSANTSYSYTLRACVSNDINSCSAVSQAVNATTQFNIPPVPSAPTATVQSASQINLAWPAVSGASYYRLYNNSSEIYGDSNLTYNNTGLSANTSYSYTLRACVSNDINSCSAVSQAVNATTQFNIPPVPSAPTATVQSASQINLAWSAVSGANYYRLYNNSSEIYGDSNLTYNNTGLSANTSYSYTLRACVSNDINSCSAVSQAVNATTQFNIPPVPSAPTATVQSASQINLAWSAVSGANYYRLYNNSNEIYGDSNLTYNNTGLSANTSYSYTLRACVSNDINSCSAVSQAVNATTQFNIPPVPSAPTATVQSASQINLAWSAVSGANYYRLYNNSNEIYGDSNLTYNNTGLSANTSYSYTLRACVSNDINSCSAVSQAVNATTQFNIPPVPSAPTATVQSASQINLSWSAVSGANYYRLYNNSSEIYGDSNLTYNNTGLSANTSYSYTLRACVSNDINSCSAVSQAVNATTQFNIPPVPSAPTATVQSASRIDIEWSAVSGANYYRLYNNSNEIYGDSNLTYNNTGLSANTSYSYTLSACVSNDINSCSAVSLAVNATTQFNIPPVPSAPTATVQSASQINLSWSAVSGASYYRLYNNSSEIYGDSNLTYNNTGLSANTSYSYTLRACVSNDINSCSAVSQAVNATTQFNIPPVPSAPTATVQSASQINLAWSAVSGANYYRLYNNSNEIYGDSNLTYNNTGLSANTSYSYTLRACVSNDINSCSAVSQAVNATTQFNIPPVPSAPTATVQSASQINLAWSAVSGASYYRLYNNSSEIYGDSNLTYNNTGLSANTSYSYTLSACVSNDINSCSAVSLAVNATTQFNIPPVPSAPTATVQSASQINLAWPAVSGANYYRLYNNSNEIYGDSNLTYNNTGLSANTSYSYTLRACVSNDINSCSAVSQAVNATTQFNIPPVPSAPTATVQSASQINLAWSAVSGANYYRLYNNSNEIYGDSNLTYNNTGLSANTSYSYTLRACVSNDINSCSAVSQAVNATTLFNIPPVPSAPTATVQSASQINLAWSAVSGASYYRLYNNSSEIYGDSNLTYNNTGLSANTSYSYTLSACVSNDINSCSAVSLAVSATTLLNAPSAPTATVQSASQINLAWSAVSGASYYRLYNNSSEIYGDSNLTYNNTGLSANTSYSYTLSACVSNDINSCSAVSLAVNATTQFNIPPVPSAPTATVQSASQINLAWSAVSGANYYRLYNNSSEIYGDSNLTYNNTGLSANTSYSYTLRACVSNDINSCSAVSQAVNATTQFNILPVPSAPTATVQSASQINLAWSAVSGANYYRLYNNSSEIYGDSNLTYNNTGLSANTSYSYTLSACVSNDINSCSAVSLAVSATTLLNAPSAPTATVQSASQINLAWSAVSGASYYRLYNNSSEIYGDSNLTYNNTGLSANTSYSYTLSACVSNDINSCSAVSLAVSATTLLNAPSAPTATVQSASQINLAWSAVSGASYYRLYNNSSEIYGDSNLTYNNTGLSANTSYSYTLSACVSNDINSCSAVSQAVSATTLLNAPSAPTATVQSASQINLAWSAVSGASYYRLYNNSSEIYGDSNLTYNNTGLSANTSYSYTLRACVSNDINSCSAVSQAVNATTQFNIPPVPSAPTATVQSASQINLSWSAVSGASYYRLYNNSSEIYGDSNLTYNNTGLSANTSYSYTLRACVSNDINSCSAVSLAVNATTQFNIPPVPSAPTATVQSASRIDIEWSAVSGASYYRLYNNSSEIYGDSNLTYNNTGLSANTSYSYTLSACVSNDINSCSAVSLAVSATTLLNAPSAPTATVQSASQINLAWSAVSGASYYRLYNNSSEIYGDSNLTYNNTGLSANTSYSYTLRACVSNDINSCSAVSQAVSATTLFNIPPVPSAPTATVQSASQINLAWSAVSGASYYRLYNNSSEIYGDSNLTYNNTGLSANTSYSYTLRACVSNDINSCSAVSLAVSATTLLNAPSAPTATVQSASQINLSWSAVSGASYYRLYNNSSEIYGDSNLTYNNTGLSANTSYSYTLRACVSNDINSCSAVSLAVSATTLLNAPSAPTATVQSASQINLAWSAVSGASYYRLYNNSSEIYGDSNLTYNNTGLSANTSYSYTLSACVSNDINSCSAVSLAVSATTLFNIPPVPSAPTATVQSASQINLAWSAVSGASYYRLYNNSSEIYGDSNLTYNNTGLSANTSYSYTLSACVSNDINSCSAVSLAVSATTLFNIPPVPSAPTATVQSASQINLAWSAVSGASYYRLYNNSSEIYGDSNLTYNNTGLSANTSYSYTLSACVSNDINSCSAVSLAVSATTLLNAPSAPTATVQSASQINLSWSAVSGASYYRLYNNSSEIYGDSNLTYNNTGLSANTSYSYTLSACVSNDINSCSAVSLAVSATTLLNAPSAPTATVQSASQINLSWSAVSGASYYRLYNNSSEIYGDSNLTYNNTGLSANTSYSYTLSACVSNDINSCSAVSLAVSATTLLNAPSAPTATVQSASQINLAWSAVSGASYYRLYNNSSEIYGDSNLTYNNTGLSANTSYSYTLSACVSNDINSCSAVSLAVSATTLLNAPSAPTATVQSASQINLAWSAVSGASYYRLYNNSSEIYGDSNLTYNNTGLSANTSYSYTLRACVSNDINSCSAVSLAVSATTLLNAPSAPTATVQSASQINLSWSAVSGASYYRLYNNSSEIYGDSNLTYNNTGLSANTSYSYTLRACVSNDINSCSAVSLAVSATTLFNIPPVPSAPTATVQSASQINLAWSAVSGASYYRLYNNSSEIYGDSNLTYNNTGLSANTSYSYTLSACVSNDINSCSAVSLAVSATTLLNAPSAPTATVQSASQINLAWSAVSGASYYRLYNNSSEIYGDSNLTYNNTGLSANTSYSYTLSACVSNDINSCSAVSLAVSATTLLNAPSAPTATVQSASQINLAWSAVSGASYYRLYNNSSEIYGDSNLTYNNTGLSANTSYSYTLRACVSNDINSCSAVSLAVSATTLFNIPPVPSAPTATVQSASQINLAWSAVSGASYYRLYNNSSEIYGDSNLTYNNTGLSANTSYSYTLSACVSNDINSCSAVSLAVSATTLLNAPSAPTATVQSASQINLAWSAVSGASYYRLYNNSSEIYGDSNLTYNNTGLSANTSYSYTLSACVSNDINSCSAVSLAVSATTLLNAPSAPTATVQSASQINLAWSAVSGASYYRLYNNSSEIYGDSNLTYNNTGLSANTSYSYTLSACVSNDINSCSAVSQAVSATTLLNAPSAPTATVQSASQINLAWSAVSGASYYRLYNNSSEIYGDSNLTYNNTGLSANTSYSYTLRACVSNDINSCSAVSQAVNATTQFNIPPVPSAPTATVQSASQINLSWSAVSGASYYRLYNNSSEIYGDSNLTYNNTGLSANTSYSYTLRACVSNDINSCSAVSLAVNATTQFNIPPVPSAPTATVQSASRIDIEWSAVSGASYYRLYNNSSEIYGDSNLTYNNTGLSANTSYSYTLSACVSNDINSCSAVSLAVSATTLLNAPSAPTATVQSASQINLAWSAVSGASYYRLYNNSSEIYGDSNLTYNNTGLSANTSYSYTLRACVSNDINSCSAVSLAVSATTLLNAPSAPTATVQSASQINLAWSAVSGASYYRLYNNSSEIYGDSNLTYNNTGLSANTSYSYTLSACVSNDINSCSAVSLAVSATTLFNIPPVPSAPTATVQSASQINLAWSAVSGASYYRLYNNSSEIYGDSNLTYNNTGLSANTSYSYTLSACVSNDINSCSAVSLAVSATTLLNAPSAPTATVQSASQINLSWSAVSGASYYRLYNNSSEIYGDSNLTYNNTGLSANTSYSYTLSACVSNDINSCSAVSLAVSATTLLNAPSAPTATVQSASQINLSWSAVSGASYYRLYNNSSEIYGDSNLTYNNTGLSANTSYSYTLSACVSNDINSCSAVSLAVSATTLLNAPSAPTATVQSASQINLAWSAVSGASYYRLYNNSSEIYGDSNLTYNNTGLSANTSYSYTLSACVSNDINSCSAVSQAVSATTLLNAPSAPTATVQSASQINLAWSAVSGASYYRLYNNSSEIYGDSNLTYNNTGLSANTSYSYTLRACVSNDINSCSAVSQAVNATTQFNIPPVPSAPTATVQSASQINLSWSAVSGASYYRLYNNSSEIYGDSNLTYNNTGLSANTSYSYTLRACVSNDINSCSAVSLAVNATTQFNIPPVPSAPTATVQSASRIDIEWSAVSGASYYRLYNNSSEIYGDSNLTYNNTGLSANTSYSYTLSACVSNDINSCSAVSLAVSATTLLNAPSAPTATVQSASQINLAWSAVSGASYYRLYNNSSEIYGDSNLTYNNTGLSANTSYSYTLRACVSNDINSCSAVSLAVSATTLLNAPSAPTATVQSASQINLAWSAVSGASYYRLYNNSSEIYGDSNLTYNNTGLSANTSYSYTLSACVSNDINSCSAVSLAVSATTLFNIPPVPSAPTATVQSASQINLAWSAVSGASYYRLYNNSSEIYGDSNLTYNNTGLSANTSYSYTLSACVSNDINSCSAVSLAVSATTLLNAPSAPTATVQSASQINLSWSAVSGASYYRLYNNSSEIYGDSNLTYNNTGLSANTSYSYTLSACVSNDINSCSAVSLAVSATTLLNAPSAPTATVQSASQINLSWSAVSGASYYRLYNNSSEIYGDSNLTYNNTGLSANTSYSYTLRACVSNDINSCSAVSLAVSATTLFNIPPVPSAPTATVQSASQINLAWSAVSGASYYRLYNNSSEIYGDSNLTYNNTGLSANTSYSYTLSACVSNDINSCSAVSLAVSATTLLNAPSAPTATVQSASQINLAWSAVSGASYYRLYNNSSEIYGDSNLTYNNTGLSANTSYSYTLSACVSNDINSCSAVSLAVSATTLLNAPSAPTATVQSASQINLSWSAVSGASYYRLYNNSSEIYGDSNLTYNNTGLSANTSYSYTLSACVSNDINSCSAVSLAVSATTLLNAPSAPTATVQSASQINLSWSAVSGASYYRLYNNSSEIYGDSNLTYNNTGLSANTSYSYTLSACVSNDINSCSAVSLAVSATTLLNAPSAPTATVQSASQINLSWSAVSGASYYRLYNNSSEIYGDSNLTYNNTGLSANTSYSYTLSACVSNDINSCSAVSLAVSATTLLNAPSAPTATVQSASQINLAWSAVSGASYYRLYNNSSEIYGDSNLTYNNTGLSANTSYSYTLSACVSNDINSCSAVSLAVSATTLLNAPSAPTATVQSASQINLAWSAVSGASYYRLYNNSSEIYGDSNLTYNNTGLSANTSYSYTLSACVSNDINSCSAVSLAVSATTLLNAPSAPTATVQSASQINLAWSAVSGASYYRLYNNSSEIYGDSNLTYNNTGLSANTSYSYTLSACVSNDINSCSAVSLAVSATTLLNAPSAPTATVQSASQINLSWSAVSGASYYRLYNNSSEIYGDSNLTYNNTGLSANTSYSYTLSACVSNDINSCSAVSLAVSATTLFNIPPVPSAPTATVQSASRIDIEWSAVSGANYYRLYNNSNYIYGGGNIPLFNTGLSANTSYSYTLRACVSNDINSCSAVSLAVNATTLLNAPSAPTATVQSASQINLSWSAVLGASDYEVYRATNNISASSTKITNPNPTTESYTDTGLIANTLYYYWLKACSSSCSDYSNAVSATTQFNIPPVPSAPTATVQSASQINLAWSAVSGASYYRLYNNSSEIYGDSNLTYNNTGLSANTSYSYTLSACVSNDINSCSAVSLAVSATTLLNAPSALTATVQSASQINLSWSAVSGANYYRLYNNSNYIYSGGLLPYPIFNTGLSANTSYSYTLRACVSNDINSCSAVSQAVSAITLLNTPSAPTATVQSTSQINLSWPAVLGASDYEVYRATNNISASSTKITNPNPTTESYTDTGLIANTLYYYWLKACSSSCSDYSNAVSATTQLNIPSAPTTTSSTDTINLTWSAISGASYYEIYRYSSNDVNGASLTNSTTNPTILSYTDIGLSQNTLYYYWLKACNGAGCSDYSNYSGAKTQSIGESLNDTGITFGGGYSSGNNSTCTSNISSAQDCNDGRDASLTLAVGSITYNGATEVLKVGAGSAGFDWIKLGASGTILSIQDGIWSVTGSESAGTIWSCVRDNQTGLVWEVKTTDRSDIHYDFKGYRWGGLTAIGRNHPDKEGTYSDIWNSLVNGSNNEGLCGFNNWRVPSIDELTSIVHYGVASTYIDDNYFPNTEANTPYWSSSPIANDLSKAWAFFNGGSIERNRTTDNTLVRLVRSGE